jgi:hypothetical protein
MRSEEDIQYLHDLTHFCLFQGGALGDDEPSRIEIRAVHDAACWLLGIGDHAEQDFVYKMHRLEFHARQISKAYPHGDERGISPFDRELFSNK